MGKSNLGILTDEVIVITQPVSAGMKLEIQTVTHIHGKIMSYLLKIIPSLSSLPWRYRQSLSGVPEIENMLTRLASIQEIWQEQLQVR